MDATLPAVTTRRLRVAPWMIVGVVSLATAVLYVWMRWALVEQAHVSNVARCANLSMAPGEATCGAGIVGVASAQLGWALLSGIAVALPAHCSPRPGDASPPSCRSPRGWPRPVSRRWARGSRSAARG